jgi:hypothetical protein
MQAHQGWIAMPSIDLCDATHEYRTNLLDEILSARLNNYITTIRGRLQEKLRLHSLELNEVNIFTLLLSSSIDYILEYTNESIVESGLPKVSPQEFRRFIGTVLLSSTFSVSTDLSWSLMEALTNNIIMPRDRFNAILQNLRGFELMGRTANRNNPVWLDQRDLMQNLHHLEEKIFERSKKFFFDTRNGCYVLDDELLPSKATDLESKTLCSRKTGKEGSTADIICDSFLQIVLGMRLRTSSDTQLENVEKLLDTFPPIEENRLSDFGPLLACDRGYGKKKVIQLFAKKHYKVITVCAAAGSEHPIVPTSVVNAYHKKLLSQQSEENMVLQQDDDSEMIDSLSNISQWTIADNEDVLLGPEIKVAMDAEVEQLYAIAYRDIFDKKIAQKILRFFIYGFPNSTAIINDGLWWVKW